MPSAEAAAAGATQAPDKGYTDLLAAAGHTVTRFQNTAAPNAANLNTNFDLVIISRSAPSTDFNPGAPTAAWAGITTPIMFLHGYALRNSRAGFTTGATIPDTGGAIKLNVKNPAHPIFAGIALDASSVTVNDYTTGLQVFNGATMNGISVNTDPITPGGDNSGDGESHWRWRQWRHDYRRISGGHCDVQWHHGRPCRAAFSISNWKPGERRQRRNNRHL